MEPISAETLSSIRSILIQVGEYAIQQPTPMRYQLKQDMTPFTEVELEMEARIIAFLRQTFPEHQLISEESGTVGSQSAYQWFLDPIDGTKMFLIGAPTWGISLGLLIAGKPALGFFYMPKSRDFFWGGQEYGAYFNGTTLDTVIQPDFQNPLVFLGLPTNFHLKYLVKHPRVRILGSTAVHLAFVASGASIGAITRQIHLWDIAGLLPILETCNVSVQFLSGKPFSPADYLDGSLLPEELLFAREGQIDRIREMVRRL